MDLCELEPSSYVPTKSLITPLRTSGIDCQVNASGDDSWFHPKDVPIHA